MTDTLTRCLDNSCPQSSDCARWIYRHIASGSAEMVESLRPPELAPSQPCPNRYPMLSFYARRQHPRALSHNADTGVGG